MRYLNRTYRLLPTRPRAEFATQPILGYARVSTSGQDLTGQRLRLDRAGAIRIFETSALEGTMDRPGLQGVARNSLDVARGDDQYFVGRRRAGVPCVRGYRLPSSGG